MSTNPNASASGGVFLRTTPHSNEWVVDSNQNTVKIEKNTGTVHVTDKVDGDFTEVIDPNTGTRGYIRTTYLQDMQTKRRYIALDVPLNKRIVKHIQNFTKSRDPRRPHITVMTLEIWESEPFFDDKTWEAFITFLKKRQEDKKIQFTATNDFSLLGESGKQFYVASYNVDHQTYDTFLDVFFKSLALLYGNITTTRGKDNFVYVTATTPKNKKLKLFKYPEYHITGKYKPHISLFRPNPTRKMTLDEIKSEIDNLPVPLPNVLVIKLKNVTDMNSIADYEGVVSLCLCNGT